MGERSDLHIRGATEERARSLPELIPPSKGRAGRATSIARFQATSELADDSSGLVDIYPDQGLEEMLRGAPAEPVRAVRLSYEGPR